MNEGIFRYPENFSEKEENAEAKEISELQKEFAEELKNPYEGAHFKKLQRIAGAFILAGITVLSSPQTGITPEKSKQIVLYEELLGKLKTENYPNSGEYAGKMREIKIAIEERGGLEFSPQIPETIYKPYSLRKEIKVARESKNPYFIKPEVILGEDFIKNNPEKAKKYIERISKTMKSTVIIERNKSIGSGVIINTRKGKIILTNHHVIKRDKNINVFFINNKKVKGEIIGKDAINDLAILKIKIPKGAKKEEIFKNTDSLDIDFDSEPKAGERLALIGHPFSYPFEVSMAKLLKRDELSIKILGDDGDISSEPDDRFKKLAVFEIPRHLLKNMSEGGIALKALKGEAIPGMSGGPIIKLDGEGEPKLMGINYARNRPISASDPVINFGKNSQTIREFLEEQGY